MTMTKLKLADGLSLPLDTVTEKLAFLGRTGTGKTYAAMKLAEEMLIAGAQIIALDAVGMWYGLRIDADPDGPHFTLPVFGGLHGDFPLEATGGRLLADVIVDRAISAVLDVSQFTKGEQTRFALDFATQFYQRKKAAPSAVHVFLEECQEFVPQNAQPGEQAMLAAYERLWKLGRNFGIGGSLISQRPQEINKKALNQTGTLFVFGMTGPQERKAIEAWVSAQGINENIRDILPGLQQGQPHVWSPTFLNVSKTVRIAAKATADVSITPKVGSRAKERPLTPIDAAALAQAMAATVERAKADDPKELRRQIADLTRALAKAQIAATPVTPSRVEVPVLRDFEEHALREAMVDIDTVKRGIGSFETVRGAIEAIVTRLNAAANDRPPDVRLARTRPVAPPMIPPLSAKALARSPVDGNGSLDGAQRNILSVVAMLNARGLDPNRDMVARWMPPGGIHPKGGRYGSNLKWLREHGYLDDDWVLTSVGSRVAENWDTGLRAAQEVLDGAQRAIIDVLANDRRRKFTRESLAETIGVHPKGGRYGSNLVRLRTMGLIPERGDIYLEEAAFA